MANLSITAANVKAGANANVVQGIAGASVTPGQAVHRSASTGKFILSDANGAGLQQVDGIALNTASADQPLSVQTSGDYTSGDAGMTPGTAYWLSATAGGLCPIADLSTGADPILVGIAKSATVMMLKIADPGVTL